MKNLDINGFKVEFNIDSKNCFKTNIGGFFTISYFFFFFVLFYLLGRDSIQKNIPNGYSQIIPYEKDDKNFDKVIEKDMFLVGFGATNTNAIPFNLTGYLYPIF